MDRYELAKELLEKYNQKNILEELEKNKSEDLIKQILEIEFDKVKEIYEESKREKQYIDDKIEYIKYIDGNKISEIEKNKYYNIGSETIRKGKYAIVTMAGGQRN